MTAFLALDENSAVAPADLAAGLNTVLGRLGGGRPGDAILTGAGALDVRHDPADGSLVVNRLAARTAGGWGGEWGPERVAVPGRVATETRVCLGFTDAGHLPVRPGSAVSVWSPGLRLVDPSAPPDGHGAVCVGVLKPAAGRARYVPLPVWADRVDGCAANVGWAGEVDAELGRHEDAWVRLAAVADRERGGAVCAAWLGGVLAALDSARVGADWGVPTGEVAARLAGYLRRVSALPARVGSDGLRSLLGPVVEVAAAAPPIAPGLGFARYAAAVAEGLRAAAGTLDRALEAAGVRAADRLPAEVVRDARGYCRVGVSPVCGSGRVELSVPSAAPLGLAVLVRAAAPGGIRAGDVTVRDGRAGGRKVTYLGAPEGAFHWLPPRPWVGQVVVEAGGAAELVDVALYDARR